MFVATDRSTGICNGTTVEFGSARSHGVKGGCLDWVVRYCD